MPSTMNDYHRYISIHSMKLKSQKYIIDAQFVELKSTVMIFTYNLLILYYFREREMNQLKLDSEQQDKMNHSNASSLNYSLLRKQMDEEQKRQKEEKQMILQKQIQINSRKAQSCMSQVGQNTPSSPISQKINFSLKFQDFDNFLYENKQKKIAPAIKNNEPKLGVKSNQLKIEKLENKMIASIVKQQMPKSNNQQIQDESSIMHEESQSDNNSHFKQAAFSDDDDDDFFLKSSNPKPSLQQKQDSKPVEKMQSRQSKKQVKLSINVIDSNMKVSNKQTFKSQEPSTGKRTLKQMKQIKQASQLLESRTSSINIPTDKQLFKAFQSSKRLQKNMIQNILDEKTTQKEQRAQVKNSRTREIKSTQTRLKKTESITKKPQQEYFPKEQVPMKSKTKSINELQVPNRMKSTYDHQLNTQFNLLLNQGNLSQPSNKKSSSKIRQRSKAVNSESNSTQQDNRNMMKQQIIQKIKNIQEAFINIQQNERQRQRNILMNQKNNQDLFKKKKDILRVQKRTQPMQNFEPDETIQNDSQHQNNKFVRHNTPRDQNSIMKELSYLRQKLYRMQQQTTRTIIKQNRTQNNTLVYDKIKRPLKNKSDLFHQTIKISNDSLKTSRDQKSNMHNVSFLSNTQEFVNMESLLSHFDYEIFKETPVNEIVQKCMEIIQLFSLKIDNQSSIGLGLFKQFVQIQFQGSGIIVNWKFRGQFYIGTFSKSPEQVKSKHGQGIQILKNEYVYKGNFAKNKKQGFGLIYHTHGQQYIGEWSNNLYEGKGRKTDNKSSYQGYFFKGMKDKRGVEQFYNGDLYEGEYVNDKFQGKGKYLWTNSTFYNGSFVQGFMEGYGYWRSAAGDKYQGNYMKNMKHGNGVYASKTGKKLKGNFEYGRYVQKQSKIATIKQEEQLIFDEQQSRAKDSSLSNSQQGKHYKIILKNASIDHGSKRIQI